MKVLGPGVWSLPWLPELVAFAPDERSVALHARADGWLRVWRLAEARELLRWRARKPPSDLGWLGTEDLAVLHQGPPATLEVRAVPDGGLLGAWRVMQTRSPLTLATAPSRARALLSSVLPSVYGREGATALLFDGPELTPGPTLDAINTPANGPAPRRPGRMLQRAWLRADGDEVALDVAYSLREDDTRGPSVLLWRPGSAALRELPLPLGARLRQLFWLDARRVLLARADALEALVPGDPSPAWRLDTLDRSDLEVQPSLERALLIDPTHRQASWKVGLVTGAARKVTLEGRRLAWSVWCHGDDALATLGHEPSALIIARWDAARDRYAVAHRVPTGPAGAARLRRSPGGRYLLCPSGAGALMVDTSALPEGRVDVLY